MRLSKFVSCLLFLSALASCKSDNPPFGELAGTRWEGTNIAKGILIDVRAGVAGTYDISLTYYSDPVPYDIRRTKVDTLGNRKFIIRGKYTPVESTTDKGEKMYGYSWEIKGNEPDGTLHSGSLSYDNKRMYLHLDGSPYPMTQVI